MAGAALLASWLVVVATAAVDVPEITRPVTDLAEVLDASEEEAIARALVEHREATGVQLAVLLLATTQPVDIADFSQAVFDRWGGGSEERDDGALFVLAIDDRRSRLHLGYGLEPLIPDSTAKRMLDALRPALEETRYGDATQALVADFRSRTTHVEPGGAIAVPRGGVPWLWLAFVLGGLAAGVAWGFVFRRGHEAYRRDDTVSKNKGTRWTERLWAAIVGVSRHPHVRIAAAVLAVVQLSIFALFSSGTGFVGVYSLLLWIFVLSGWAMFAAPRWVGITLEIAALIGVVIAFASVDVSSLLPDGGAVFEVALPAVGVYLGFGAMALFFVASAKGGGSGGSSYGTSSSTSSSTSSYSSSYSSSSYGGGGGSSGGGGASSSW